jgi:hypothetical protein
MSRGAQGHGWWLRPPDLEVVAASVEQIANLLVVHLHERTFGAVSEDASHTDGQARCLGTYSTLSSVLALILSKM